MKISFQDDMSVKDVFRHLSCAGWMLGKTDSEGTSIAIEGGSFAGRLRISDSMSDSSSVDGHALLRSAGGGKLDAALALSVTDDQIVDELLVGLNWSMVRAGPYCGVARSPARETEGARTVRRGHPIAGQPLSSLAQWLCSLDPLRRSIGLAAVNAFWNRSDAPSPSRPFGLDRFDPPGAGLVVVGGFRSIRERLPEAVIVEREPTENDVPANAAQTAFSNARAIAITGQTLMNGSLEPLMDAIRHIPDMLLVGPSVPICPILREEGFELSGRAVTDPDAVASFIKETGTMIALDTLTCKLGMV